MESALHYKSKHYGSHNEPIMKGGVFFMSLDINSGDTETRYLARYITFGAGHTAVTSTDPEARALARNCFGIGLPTEERERLLRLLEKCDDYKR